MITLAEVKKRKEQLENALKDVNVALSHDEYTKPFEYKRVDTIIESDLVHPSVKKMYAKCVESRTGFDPNLVAQHTEKIALDRFNKIVIDELNEVGTDELMAVRHEMELLMLTERKAHYEVEVDKINRMIQELTPEVLAEINNTKKKKK